MTSAVQHNYDLISKNPERWDLTLRIEDSSISFTLNAPDEANSMTFDSMKFEASDTSFLNKLENCIYDSPILVNDYRSTTVIIDSTRFVIIPSDLFDENNYEDIFLASFPDFQGDIFAAPMNDCNAIVVFGTDKGVIPFLQRTYFNPTITHSIVPLADFFGNRAKLGNTCKMHVTNIGGRYYITVFSRTESGGNYLKFANSFDANHINDIAYYILNIWEQCELDYNTDELLLSGDNTDRQELTSILRKYIAFVMPSVFPANRMRLCRNAMDLPFDLIISQQCVL